MFFSNFCNCNVSMEYLEKLREFRAIFGPLNSHHRNTRTLGNANFSISRVESKMIKRFLLAWFISSPIFKVRRKHLIEFSFLLNSQMLNSLLLFLFIVMDQWILSNCLILKVTWLILPVVICLSQRLSHACLSINIFILWNCVQLIISVIIYLMVPYYMDTRSNSRANTCIKSQLVKEGMYLLDKKPMRAIWSFWWFIVTDRIAWLHAGDSSFKFLPYQLSTVV